MKESRRKFLSAVTFAGLTLPSFSVFSRAGEKSSEKEVLVHQVYFWLKSGLSKEDVLKFENGVKSLLKIKTIKYGKVGKPGATTQRPVIDSSYSYSLLTVFEDVKGHDQYQVDPIHEKFLKDCKELWEKVVVYDSQSF